MSTPTFSKETLSKVFDVLKDRLQISGAITTAPACQRICERLLISHSSAQAIFRFIMFQLVAIGKAKYIKRGTWQILDWYSVNSIPELGRGMRVKRLDYGLTAVSPPEKITNADLAAAELKRLGFTEKRAFDIAEQYGVSVKSLLLAMQHSKIKNEIEPEQTPTIKKKDESAYQFKTYDDD